TGPETGQKAPEEPCGRGLGTARRSEGRGSASRSPEPKAPERDRPRGRRKAVGHEASVTEPKPPAVNVQEELERQAKETPELFGRRLFEQMRAKNDAKLAPTKLTLLP